MVLAALQDVHRRAVRRADRAVGLGDEVGLGRTLEEFEILLALAGKLVDLRAQVEPDRPQVFRVARHCRAERP